MGSARFKRILSLLLRGFVVLATAYTFFSLAMLLRWALRPAPHPQLPNTFDVSPIPLPVLSPMTLYRDLPGISQSLTTLGSPTDSSDRPVRVSVVYQSDSTSFVELTYVSDCGCPAEKRDRYSINHKAVDPLTGRILKHYSEENLSAERLAQYFGGLTQIRRSQ
jgi:hypothetical protein